MGFDEEPRDLHDECAAEIAALKAKLSVAELAWMSAEQRAAVTVSENRKLVETWKAMHAEAVKERGEALLHVHAATDQAADYRNDCVQLIAERDAALARAKRLEEALRSLLSEVIHNPAPTFPEVRVAAARAALEDKP